MNKEQYEKLGMYMVDEASGNGYYDTGVVGMTIRMFRTSNKDRYCLRGFYRFNEHSIVRQTSYIDVVSIANFMKMNSMKAGNMFERMVLSTIIETLIAKRREYKPGNKHYR